MATLADCSERFTLESLTNEENGDWLTARLEALAPRKSLRAGCLSPFSGRIGNVNRSGRGERTYNDLESTGGLV
jgi:hypothetical protein